MYSGTGFITKEGKPAMIYHGAGSGKNWLSYGLDDYLDKWSKPEAVTAKTADGNSPDIRYWDPDCWLNGDTYYALSGGGDPELMKSKDLKNWEYLGKLLHNDYPADLGVRRNEDISCANMFKIGNKWMLLCISHPLGCRYYLGDFKDEKYLPEFHAMMNWQKSGGFGFFFAPESLLTKDGRRVMWSWLVKMGLAPSGAQSLPRELELPADGVLRIKPLRELASLRYDEKSEKNITVKKDGTYVLKQISGDTIELKVQFKSSPAKEYGIDVLCDANGENGLRIALIGASKTLKVGTVDVPFELKEREDLTLRVFIDKNLVEVFANDRQAVAYPHKRTHALANTRLFSNGSDLRVKKVTAWKMKSIYDCDTEGTKELLKQAASGDADGRKKAWAVLGIMARSNDIKLVMDVAVAIKTKQDLSYAKKAIRKIFLRAKDRSQCFREISDYYARATQTTKDFILGLGSESGDACALKLEQNALASGNKKLYDRALQTLVDWPNELAAADLYKQARNASGENDRLTALGGYIRIAGLESARLSAEERMVMMRKAMTLASRNEEKKQIISNLSNVINHDSLETLQKYMADTSFRDEAQESAFKLIWKLRRYNTAEAIAAAEQFTKSDDTTVAAKARKLLNRLEKNRAYIMGWMVAGPYSLEGNNGADVFEAVYPPQSGDKEVDWKRLTHGIGDEIIDLGQTFGNMKHTCVYVKTTVVSPSAQSVLLEMGSNDGIKAWFNGEQVHSYLKGRECVPGGDVKTVKLRKGKNEILLKIVNITSAWKFSCRLRQENGKHVKGLTVEP